MKCISKAPRDRRGNERGCWLVAIRPAAVAAALFCSAAATTLVRADDRPFVPSVTDVPGVPTDPAVHNAFSKPSVEHKLMFPLPGLIRDVPIKLGDTVKENQVVATLDDDIEQKELERLKIDANSTVKIDAAKADLAAKKVILARKKDMFDKQVANVSEVEEAETDVMFREAQVKVAEQETAEAKIKAQQQELKLKQMKIVSRFDGVVQALEIHPGEMADPSKKDVIVIVKNDPLWVEVKVANSEASKLRLGQDVQVRYADDEKWASAKVIFMEPYADPQSDTRKLNLELPNPEGRPSGQQMLVKLPAGVSSPAAREQNAGAGLNGR